MTVPRLSLEKKPHNTGNGQRSKKKKKRSTASEEKSLVYLCLVPGHWFYLCLVPGHDCLFLQCMQQSITINNTSTVVSYLDQLPPPNVCARSPDLRLMRDLANRSFRPVNCCWLGSNTSDGCALRPGNQFSPSHT